MKTTPEILAVGRPADSAPDTPGWSLRVFPNMYPALACDAESGSRSGVEAFAGSCDLFIGQPGVGAHEVVVYSPDHEASLSTMPGADLGALLQILRDRYAALAENPAHRYVLQFVNHGAEAGATMSHPHLQILATPVVPAVIQQKMDRMDQHRSRTGRCLVCDLLAAEKSDGARVIAENDTWIALAPWASRFSWEMNLVPRRHQGSIVAATSEELGDLAGLLGDVMRRLDAQLGNPPLNVVLHGAPLVNSDSKEYFADGTAACGAFHWHIEICPRMARLAGFETGTGFAINSVLPEEAARKLRGEDG